MKPKYVITHLNGAIPVSSDAAVLIWFDRYYAMWRLID